VDDCLDFDFYYNLQEIADGRAIQTSIKRSKQTAETDRAAFPLSS
jgi:hypothetical protein